MPDTPETPEGVALELLRIVVRAEGTPIEQLSESNKPSRAGNQDVRGYVLDTYAECLTTTKGERAIPNGDSGRN